MMADRFTAQLQIFFGPGNDITWEKIHNTPELADHINPWIERVRHSEASLLPRRVGDDLYWYGVAFSEKQMNQLGLELKAFIGFTKSEFRGRKANLDPADVVEAAVHALSGGRAYKIKTAKACNKPVWDRLLLMKRLWEEKPHLVREEVKPVGRIMRDFYMALQAGNRQAAENILAALEENHFLTPLNISFLNVQILDSLGTSDELMKVSELPELILMRRPLLVTEALIKALYRQELAVFETSGDFSGAAEHFAGSVYPQYQNLFRYMASMSNPDVLKCFMLLAVTGKPSQPHLRDIILTMQGLPDTDRAYLSNIATLLADTTAVSGGSPMELANKAFERGDYDRAVFFAIKVPTQAAVKILFESAYETQALTVRKVALEAYVELSAAARDSFLSSRRNRELYEHFTGMTFDQILPINEMLPSDWSQWLSRLNQRGHWKQALTIAALGAAEWDADTFLSQPGIADQLCPLLEFTRDDQSDKTLADAIPLLLAFLQRDTAWPRRELQKVYQLLMELLVLSSDGGDDDLALFNELVAALLGLGQNENGYRNILTNARDIWRQFAAPGKLDWVLDFLDLLLFYPCQDEEKRLDLLLNLTNDMESFSRRIEKRQLAFLYQLFADLDKQEYFEDLVGKWGLAEETPSLTENVLDGLNGKTVAIYTLSERVARRVKELLERWCQNVSVTMNWDKAGSERLKQMARNADIFVMTWSCAKHAATEFIQANRAKEMPLLWVRGKGSSSIISAISGYLSEMSA